MHNMQEQVRQKRLMVILPPGLMKNPIDEIQKVLNKHKHQFKMQGNEDEIVADGHVHVFKTCRDLPNLERVKKAFEETRVE